MQNEYEHSVRVNIAAEFDREVLQQLRRFGVGRRFIRVFELPGYPDGIQLSMVINDLSVEASSADTWDFYRFKYKLTLTFSESHIGGIMYTDVSQFLRTNKNIFLDMINNNPIIVKLLRLLFMDYLVGEDHFDSMVTFDSRFNSTAHVDESMEVLTIESEFIKKGLPSRKYRVAAGFIVDGWEFLS